MEERRAWIAMRDGIRLAARLWIPDVTPAPVLLEALPYRMDDLTSSYVVRVRAALREGGFAVCRLDIRGTGSSEGIAEDEYTPTELDDICEVIAWLAAQEWSNGRVGMYGTSWSGFNSIQVACMRPPALGAIAPIYATDDRYTDDVHYMGGAVKAVDLVDWVTYMVALQRAPAGPGGLRGRLARGVAAAHRGHRAVGAALARGAARRAVLAPRVAAARLRPHRLPDDDRRRLGRRVPQQHVAHVRGAALPEAPADRAVEPHVDRHVAARARTSTSCPELMPLVRPLAARRAERRSTRSRRSSLFARRSTRPEPDLAEMRGEWRTEPTWPAARLRARRFCAPPATAQTRSTCAATRHDRVDLVRRQAAVGSAVDQRPDDALSLVYDWEPLDEELELLGHPRLRLTLTPAAPVQYLSARSATSSPTARRRSSRAASSTSRTARSRPRRARSSRACRSPSSSSSRRPRGSSSPVTAFGSRSPAPTGRTRGRRRSAGTLVVDRGSVELELPVLDGAAGRAAADASPLPPGKDTTRADDGEPRSRRRGRSTHDVLERRDARARSPTARLRGAVRRARRGALRGRGRRLDRRPGDGVGARARDATASAGPRRTSSPRRTSRCAPTRTRTTSPSRSSSRRSATPASAGVERRFERVIPRAASHVTR